jgi:hypothetical protein
MHKLLKLLLSIHYSNYKTLIMQPIKCRYRDHIRHKDLKNHRFRHVTLRWGQYVHVASLEPGRSSDVRC